MADIDDSRFKEFLAAYQSGHHLLADLNDSNLSDDQKRAEIAANSELVRKYEYWSSLPQNIIDAYQGHVPDYILEVAANHNETELRLLIENPRMKQEELEEKARLEYAKERDAWLEASGAVITATMVASLAQPIMDAGYNEKTANALGFERAFRDSMAETLKHRPFTEEERRLWLESRRETFRIIRDDWIEHHPERYLIHLLKKYDRDVRHGKEITEEDLRARVQEIANTITRIQSKGRLEHFEEYMERPLIRRKIELMRPETLDTMLKISEQMRGEGKHKASAPTKDNLKNIDLSRELPADVVDILKKMQIVQNNRRQNAEVSIDKNEAYQNISPLVNAKVREREHS